MSQDRTSQLLSIRPALPFEVLPDSAAEQFQNFTLRPILKFQNTLLLNVFRQYISKRKNVFYKLTPQKQLEYIEHSIRKDLRFKNLLLGMVYGLFSEKEWKVFLEQEAEIRRRTTDLLVQRIQNQSDQLTV